MLTVRLTRRCTERIVKALRKAGTSEIGGVLVGEHGGPNFFEILDVSVQTSGSSESTFIRSGTAHDAFMEEFRRRHSHDHVRFNYLGEWHSHPSFSVVPSSSDLATMKALIEDPEQRASFAVLLIVKLDEDGRLQAGATCHQPHAPVGAVNVLVESDQTFLVRTWTAVRRYFGQ